MAAGDVEEAHAQLTHLVAGVAPDEPILPSFPSDVTNEAQVVRIALAAGDERLAQRAVALAEERASLNPDVASIVGAARHARGLLDSDLSVLEAAVEAYRTSPRRMALAFALEDAAVCALAQDLRHQSIECLAQALELVSAMNARSDANRLRQRLRGLGVRQRVLVADRPTHGWAALTPSELAVVRAITGGMTNREAAEALFLSPHTVGSHLRHVFSKLNINSRVELTRMSGEYANEIATARKLPGHR
jgi:DNA-binding CsgD family transcriptional regulator